ncbi:hypothetical protein BDF19DRAFT_416659 [Syncephalis fuscata]|nr:hypothetical protein BDF19DRAFT_416659 [Syncephalis fuscata]
MSTANARSVLKRARLAREQQRKEGSSRDDGDHDTTEPIQESRRIQSPLARYDTQGRLSCAICKVVIKSSVDWPAHLTSNSHQATIEQLRKLKRSSTEKNTFNQEEETSEPKKLKTSKDTFTAPRPISKRKITSSSLP